MCSVCHTRHADTWLNEGLLNSALGGKAETMCSFGAFPLLTRTGHMRHRLVECKYRLLSRYFRDTFRKSPVAHDCVVVDAARCEPVSASKFPANREINREFRRIRPSIAIFVSGQRADSIAYSGIPYATEQGIFKCVSGNFFRRTGKSSQTTAKPRNYDPTPCVSDRTEPIHPPTCPVCLK